MCKGDTILLVHFGAVAMAIGTLLSSGAAYFLINYDNAMRWLFAPVATISLSLGLAIFIIGIFSCVAINRQSECLRTGVFVAFIIILATLVTISSLAIINKVEGFRFIRETMRKETEVFNENGILAFAHAKFHCCGYAINVTRCTRPYPPLAKCQPGSPLCSKSCLTELWNELIEPMLDGLAIFLLAVCVLLFSSIFLYVCFCTNHGTPMKHALRRLSRNSLFAISEQGSTVFSINSISTTAKANSYQDHLHSAERVRLQNVRRSFIMERRRRSSSARRSALVRSPSVTSLTSQIVERLFSRVRAVRQPSPRRRTSSSSA